MEPGAIEVARDRLYYICVRTVPHDTASSHFFTVDDTLHYWPFFLDFGPLSLGNLYRFSQLLNAKLLDKSLASKRIYLYSGPQMNKRANAVYLLAAYTLLYHGRTPEEAWRPFAAISPPLAPWHDASPTVDTFHLSVLDVLRGINKARECRFFSFDRENFDVEEYEHYERVENGDMNWLSFGRFLAFAGPHDARTTTAEGYHTTAVDDVIPYFKAKGVTAVIRLNKKYYNEKRFLAAGIDHHDMYYLDGSNPPEPILQRFLATCEQTPGAIAVHCKAGLGRTGTCIGAYCMKHYRFTAREIIGWMRVCRPGSVIGPQQHFMEEIQQRMWEEGDVFRRAKRLPMPVPSSLLGQYQAASSAAAASSSSSSSSGLSSVSAGRAGGMGGGGGGGGGGTGSNNSSPTAASGSLRGSSSGAGAMPSGSPGSYGASSSPGSNSGSSAKPRITTTTTTPSHGGGGGGGSGAISPVNNYGAPSPVAVGMPGSPTRMAGSGMASGGGVDAMMAGLSLNNNNGNGSSNSSGSSGRSSSRNGGSRGGSGSPLMRARAASGATAANAASASGSSGSWSLNGGGGGGGVVRTSSSKTGSTVAAEEAYFAGGGGGGGGRGGSETPSTPISMMTAAAAGSSARNNGYASPGSSPIATSVLSRARSRGATGGGGGADTAASYGYSGSPVAVPATKAAPAPAVGSYGGFSSPSLSSGSSGGGGGGAGGGGGGGAAVVHPSAAFRTPDGVYAQGDMLRSAKSRSPQVMMGGALSPTGPTGQAGFVMPTSPLGNNARYGAAGGAGGAILSPSGGMTAAQGSSSVRSPVGFSSATSPGLVPISSAAAGGGAPASSPTRYQIRR